MRRARSVVVTACAVWALGACGNCGLLGDTSSSSGPSQSELASATIGGHWKLTVVVDPYSGPPPPVTDVLQPGHRGVDEVVFVSHCAGQGSCTLQMWGPEGPDPGKASYYRFYSDVTGLEGPPVSTPMTQSGTAYSQSIPIAGFGGARCPPSPTVRAPQQRLTLNVTGASKVGDAWSASRLTGTETFDAGWGCAGGVFSGWTVGHLTMTGVPG